MGLRYTGNMEAFRKQVQEAQNRLNQATLMRLSRLGEQAVEHAKSIPPEIGFKDVTTNLRSSIGYSVYFNGNRMNSTFSGTQKGSNTGSSFADEVSRSYPTGWVLVVVAGMEYAIEVESRGKDVLSSAENLVFLKMPTEIDKIKASMRKTSNQ